jgi:hypothetical protein
LSLPAQGPSVGHAPGARWNDDDFSPNDSQLLQNDEVISPHSDRYAVDGPRRVSGKSLSFPILWLFHQLLIWRHKQEWRSMISLVPRCSEISSVCLSCFGFCFSLYYLTFFSFHAIILLCFSLR